MAGARHVREQNPAYRLAAFSLFSENLLICSAHDIQPPPTGVLLRPQNLGRGRRQVRAAQALRLQRIAQAGDHHRMLHQQEPGQPRLRPDLLHHPGHRAHLGHHLRHRTRIGLRRHHRTGHQEEPERESRIRRDGAGLHQLLSGPHAKRHLHRLRAAPAPLHRHPADGQHRNGAEQHLAGEKTSGRFIAR